jgi:hypothetical protein
MEYREIGLVCLWKKTSQVMELLVYSTPWALLNDDMDREAALYND